MQPSLEQVYDAHADALYSFLLSCTRNHAQVQDALQEVFLKLARRPSLLEKARDDRRYLLQSAHNALRDIVRRSITRTVYEDRHAVEAPSILLPVFPSDDDAFRIAVEASLDSIPAEQRAVLHLKLWEDLTFAQIAEALEISPHTAASRYRYALDKLRDLLRPVYEERV